MSFLRFAMASAFCLGDVSTLPFAVAPRPGATDEARPRSMAKTVGGAGVAADGVAADGVAADAAIASVVSETDHRSPDA